MKHDEFIGQVQHRARLSTRATLETLAERLAGGEAKKTWRHSFLQKSAIICGASGRPWASVSPCRSSSGA
jgi:hypothetical protein